MEKLGIIGFGVMGEAFARGLRRERPELPIVAFDVKKERLASAGSALGISTAASAAEVVSGCGLTILCVKPQDLKALLAEIREASRAKRIVSILAGKGIDTLAAGLSTDQIARFMPNIAALTGKALVGISYHEKASTEFREECLSLVRALGTPMEIPERLMAAMTGTCGSGIAFALCFIHAMAQGGVAAGFDYASAVKVAVGATEGALSLLADGTHPQSLVSRVTSPAGTTIAGVRALEKGGFTAAVMEAVEAAGRRAQELEG